MVYLFAPYSKPMAQIKISVVFGTRPEVIKLAPIILAMKTDHRFECRVCATAQQRQLLDQVMPVFGVVPDVDLDLMQDNQTLSGLTARTMEALDSYYKNERPNLVLVQGDTTTVLCASLAAFYNRIPVGHVEAGLRTGNMNSPWPEEANRVLTARIASLHFAPTSVSRDNLLKEGLDPERIFVTGNTVIDALFIVKEKIGSCLPTIPGLNPILMAPTNNSPIVLITGHRRDNFGKGFESICRAIAELAFLHPNVQFVYPVHLNPNVRNPVARILGSSGARNIHLIDPLPYLPFVALMIRATLILTDSGGIQEEAPSLGKPVLVMRESTERPEAISAGTAKLVGTKYERIVLETSKLLTDQVAYEKMAKSHNPYGDGKAARRIVEILATIGSV